MAQHYESNKFDDAFDCNVHLVMVERLKSNRFYDAFDSFDSNANVVMASSFNRTNCMMLLIFLILMFT